MATGIPVQLNMNNSHKQANGAIAHSPAVAETTPSNILSETTAATWLAIGSLAESLGDLDKALASYDAALRHSPNNPESLTKLANIYRSKDVFFKAAELYEQALNFSPENGETWGLLGHCYLMLDDLQRAYAAYQRALYYLDNPNVPKLWHGIGILYDRYGSLEYAEEAFVRVLELDSNFDKSNEIYFRLGIIYKHQGKLQSSLECFQYILGNPPHPLTQPDVWFQIGSVLEQQKDWNGAKEAYEKVLQVNPQHAKVLQQLGCLYSQADGVQTNPNGQKFQQDLNMALKYMSQSLEIDPSDAHSWYYLGRVHMIRRDFNAAYEAFQQAVNRDSRNPTFWCSIGVLYYQISQYRDALDAYTRAIRLNPYISEVWYDLGTLYETCNNQISDALDAYRQAERLDPGNPHIKARLDQLIKYQQEGNTHPPQPPPVSQQPRLPQGMVLESTQIQQHHQQSQPPQQPQHLVAGQLPGQPPQGQPPQGQPHQGQSLQGQPLQGQPLQVQPLQGQPLQGHPIPQPSHHRVQQSAQNETPAPAPSLPQLVQAQPNAIPVHQVHQQHPPHTTQSAPLVTNQRVQKEMSQPEQAKPVVTAAPEPLPTVSQTPQLKDSSVKSSDTVSNTPSTRVTPNTVQHPTEPHVESQSVSSSIPGPNPSNKHDLEEKSDSKKVKKPYHSPKNSLNSLMNAANAASEQEKVKAPNSEDASSKPVSVPQFSSNVTDKVEELTNDEENEEKKYDEPVEPPLRKVEEDEDYDDE